MVGSTFYKIKAGAQMMPDTDLIINYLQNKIEKKPTFISFF